MSLKRKASFPTIISPRTTPPSNSSSTVPIPFLSGDVITRDETPRHMHSRTRKRFRNDQPDKQAIHDKTMQILYSAQKQLKNYTYSASTSPSPTPIDTDADADADAYADIDDSMNTTFLLPAAPDPKQQSLWKFFQPARASNPASTKQ